MPHGQGRAKCYHFGPDVQVRSQSAFLFVLPVLFVLMNSCSTQRFYPSYYWHIDVPIDTNILLLHDDGLFNPDNLGPCRRDPAARQIYPEPHLGPPCYLRWFGYVSPSPLVLCPGTYSYLSIYIPDYHGRPTAV